jgi:hypothetical protein
MQVVNEADKYTRFRDRAVRALGGRRVDEAVARVRAIIGVPNIPAAETAAQTALDKLSAGTRPAAAELAALEFVIRMMRPAPLSRKGVLDPLPAQPGTNVYSPDTVARWEQFRSSIKPFIYSIGRIDLTSGNSRETGTGVLVGEDLLLTNHHVLSILSNGSNDLDEGQAEVRFYQEADAPDPTPAAFPITSVVAVHETLDMALLRVRLPAPRAVPAIETGALAANEPVAAIGYPFRDDRNPMFMNAIFGARYGVKRGALGEVLSTTSQALFHDCSTLGGNSGSPVFSLATGRIVGLHFSGSFMYRNQAIQAGEVLSFLSRATGAN